MQAAVIAVFTPIAASALCKGASHASTQHSCKQAQAVTFAFRTMMWELGVAKQCTDLNTGMSSILWPPMRSWDCMEVMRASRRRFSSFSTMNSRLRTSRAVMAASLSASARRFCSSTFSARSV